MPTANAMAEIAALIGDPGRASMLLGLMDGRALTATELAQLAGVAPQTASGHLAKMLAAGIIALERQGRHRYHRLASGEIAAMLETMMQVAARTQPHAAPRVVRTGPRDAALRAARTCYDHFAGQLGVAIADAMQAQGRVELDADGGTLTPDGHRFLADFGVDIALAGKTRRAFCKPCLDWSERRPHLGGAVGAAIAHRCFALGWVRRIEGTRAVTVTPHGQMQLRRQWGLTSPQG